MGRRLRKLARWSTSFGAVALVFTTTIALVVAGAAVAAVFVVVRSPDLWFILLMVALPCPLAVGLSRDAWAAAFQDWEDESDE